MNGRHPDARSASEVTSRLRKIRTRPVRTLVAVTNSLMGALASRSKSTFVDRIRLSGFRPVGFTSYGEKTRDARSKAMYRGLLSIVQRPSTTSSGPRRSGLSCPARATALQKLSRAARAPSAPPAACPATRTAAFIAPAEVPETPSMRSHGSSSRRSRTPHVKAPWAPPPWSPRSIDTASRELIRNQPPKRRYIYYIGSYQAASVSAARTGACSARHIRTLPAMASRHSNELAADSDRPRWRPTSCGAKAPFAFRHARTAASRSSHHGSGGTSGCPPHKGLSGDVDEGILGARSDPSPEQPVKEPGSSSRWDRSRGRLACAVP